ncbi:uncharacterized protein LOC144142073 [Haemaphysalis longicornis]
MNSVLRICLVATLLTLCYGHYNSPGWQRRFYIPQFMIPEARIWFWATTKWTGPQMCIRDNVHNATQNGIAFTRTYVNRTEYEQDFFVQQMYGRYYDPLTMIVRKISGRPEDVSVEKMLYTNGRRNCAVFLVWSLTGPDRGRYWCDLRINHKAIRHGPTYDCQLVFWRYPCHGWKRQLFTDMCKI